MDGPFEPSTAAGLAEVLRPCRGARPSTTLSVALGPDGRPVLLCLW
jgi:hypothetical protein